MMRQWTIQPAGTVVWVEDDIPPVLAGVGRSFGYGLEPIDTITVAVPAVQRQQERLLKPSESWLVDEDGQAWFVNEVGRSLGHRRSRFVVSLSRYDYAPNLPYVVPARVAAAGRAFPSTWTLRDASGRVVQVVRAANAKHEVASLGGYVIFDLFRAPGDTAIYNPVGNGDRAWRARRRQPAARSSLGYLMAYEPGGPPHYVWVPDSDAEYTKLPFPDTSQLPSPLTTADGIGNVNQGDFFVLADSDGVIA